MSKYKPIPLRMLPEKNDVEIKRLACLIYEKFRHRRTIRDFSNRNVPEEVIQNCIKVASMAPSGANHQPWHFVAISNIEIKTNQQDSMPKIFLGQFSEWHNGYFIAVCKKEK